MALGATPRGSALLALLLSTAACGEPGPRPLEYGVENCGQCHMTLADPRFAAELVTRTGRVLPFDDIGCLATFIATGGIAGDEIHSIWVHDVTRPDTLLPLEAVRLLRQDRIATPMDHGVVAVRPPALDSLRQALAGEVVTWDTVLQRVLTGRPR